MGWCHNSRLKKRKRESNILEEMKIKGEGRRIGTDFLNKEDYSLQSTDVPVFKGKKNPPFGVYNITDKGRKNDSKSSFHSKKKTGNPRLVRTQRGRDKKGEKKKVMCDLVGEGKKKVESFRVRGKMEHSGWHGRDTWSGTFQIVGDCLAGDTARLGEKNIRTTCAPHSLQHRSILQGGRVLLSAGRRGKRASLAEEGNR